MNQTDTLILEGGALRGVYTSGVLDALMELGVRIPNVVGVSAGSLNALSYLSRQPGRSRDINLNYVNDPRYMGPSHLLKTFSFFNFDFVFGQLSHELVPFDYETFYHSDQSMWAVATDCRTGKAIFYHDKEMGEEFFTACRASCSMPLLCSMVKVGEDVCLDGGIASCIPLPEELPFPAGKLVVVLTRQKGFRKKGQGPAIDQMYRRRYKNHPELMEACLHQAEDYNRRVRRIEELEQEGKAFVIRPQTPVTVTRTERDVNKLRALYQQGFDETMAQAGALLEFLGIEAPAMPPLAMRTLDASGSSNPLGMPPAAAQAAAAALTAADTYPDPDCTALRAALADRYEVLTKSVFVASGADEVIWRLARAVQPKKAVILEPAYEEYGRALEQTGCELVHLLAGPEQEFVPEAGAVEQALEGAQMLVVCNPGNPTGALLPRSSLMNLVKLCAERDVLCVVDESFIELARDGQEHSLKQDAVYCPGLVVVDSFSKAWGMPGLRVGYAISSHEELVRQMAAAGPRFGVSGPAQAAALAALRQPEHLEKTRALLETERPWLTEQLRQLGLTVLDSRVNFVLVQGPAGFADTLISAGLMVRSCATFHGLDSSWCRLAVGTRADNERLVEKLRQICTRQPEPVPAP